MSAVLVPVVLAVLPLMMVRAPSSFFSCSSPPPTPWRA
jgi:hypothetical protein